MSDEYVHPYETISSYEDYMEMVSNQEPVNNPCLQCGKEMSQELVLSHKTTRANEDDKFEYAWLCENGHVKEIARSEGYGAIEILLIIGSIFIALSFIWYMFVSPSLPCEEFKNINLQDLPARCLEYYGTK